jgi:predicted nucleic acid-binding Zn ribbon protein
MRTHANVRHGATSGGGTVVRLFPSPPAVSETAPKTCPECGKLIQTRKPASVCSPRCRAAASRRRRVDAALDRLDAAERGLTAALEVVRQLRGVLVFRGTP